MRAIQWVAVGFLVGLAGCSAETSSTPALPEASTPQAAPVAFDLPTGRLALAPVKVELAPGRGIGTSYRNVDCWVRLRSIMPADFPDPETVTGEVYKALHGAKLSVNAIHTDDIAAVTGADYLLTATIPTAHADLCIDNFFNAGPADIDAQVALSWKLWSVKDKRVVYETTTTGTAHEKDPSLTIYAGVLSAIDDATRHLLAAATTQQYLTYGRVIQPVAAPSSSGGVAASMPAGGVAPIPEPPPGIGPVVQAPAVSASLGAILVPVRAAHPAGTAFDAAAAKRVTVALGGGAAAIALGDGYLLTAAGVIGDAPSVNITLGTGTVSEARVLRRDALAGVALLKTDGALPASVPLQPRHNAVGDKVFGVAGSGVVTGSFSATKASGGHDAVTLDGALIGGPVLDPAGNVIGVLLPGGGFASMGTVFRALELGAQPADE